MPELPEVETIRRVLQKILPGLRILNSEIRKPNLLRGQSTKSLRNNLKSRKIIQVDRRAKYLIIRLEQNSLLIHLGMSGQVFVDNLHQKKKQLPDLPDKHTHVILYLNKQKVMYYRDSRMFGRVQILTPESEAIFFKSLGPEPLDRNFSVEWFEQKLAGKKATIKALR